MRRHEVRRWPSSRDQHADLVAWQWGVVLVVRGVSAWAPRRFCTGHVARGANLFGHEMVPDSSSWAGARDVSARAPSCEVMKQIFDQSLGCAILFKHATKILLPSLPRFQRFKDFL